MNRLRLEEVLIVEGKYDAVALASLVDGLILPTNGFSIFSDTDKKELIQKLGAQRGLVILTDSDAAGFQIRNYLNKIAVGCSIKNAYIPAVPGKEKRKAVPSKEGTLGVEGLPPEVLREALERAGAKSAVPKAGREITYTDLYELGLSGGQESAVRRRAFLSAVGLPQRLSKKALKEVLSSLYTYEEVKDLLREKPVLFWDFHGTLTTHDLNWFDATMEAAREQVPRKKPEPARLKEHLSGQCLPWWSIPDRDTRHLTQPGAWWNHCEGEFTVMLQKCGYTKQEAQKIAPEIRKKILEPSRYTLKKDAVDTLRRLQKQGFSSHIISNNFPELGEIVVALGLAPYIEKVIVSGQVGYDKPRREIFEVARREAGNPKEVWMIGDNPVDDIEGAKQAGFITVSVDNIQAPKADYTIGALSELVDILRPKK